MKNEILKEFVNRLKKEAVLRAFLCALAIGGAAILVTALACWFTEFSGYWIFAIAFVVPFGTAMPLFYFYVFYPSEKYVAKRLDALGLDERVLTMVEFENQDSYIMKRQREDAIAKLSTFNSKLVKFALSAALIAIPAVAVPTAVTMTTVYALSEAEVIPSGKELIGDLRRDKTTFELIYQISEEQKGCGSLLYGNSDPQDKITLKGRAALYGLSLLESGYGGVDEVTLKVGKGGDGEVVIPQAADGYVFLRWSDGVGDYIRSDTSVQGKIVVTAIFEEVDLEIKDDHDGDFNEPPPPGGSGNESGNNSPSWGNPSDPNNPPPSGGYDSNQFVFDGQTDYGGSPYHDAYDTAMGELNQSGGADGDSKGIASDYMDAISRN